MITDVIIGLGNSLMNMLFAITGVLPQVPDSVDNAINQVFNLMYNGISMLCLLCDYEVFKVIAGLFIAVVSFDMGYKVIMWIVKKIPVIDIH